MKKMKNSSYSESVEKLVTIGKPVGDWINYSEKYDLTRDDIPELIRMVTDSELRWMEAPENLKPGDELPEWYAQVHAWRALAQLGAVEAIPALIDLLPQIDQYGDEWWGEDADDVFALLGPASIEPLSAFLNNLNQPVYARAAAGDSLQVMAEHHPETRLVCVQAIIAALQNYTQNDAGLNGFLISNLADLKVVEQIDLIEAAFKAGRVDEFILGDFEDVQVIMGLLPERRTPPAGRSILESVSYLENPENGYIVTKKPHVDPDKKVKKKRKQAKLSRKKNRRKK